MWIISFLIGEASKVFQWFGSFYSTAYSRIQDFFRWLSTYANRAFTWAKNWAFPKIILYYNLAIAWIKAQIALVKNWATSKINAVRNFLLPKIQAVTGFVISKIALVWNELSKVYAKIINSDNKVIAFITNWVITKINIWLSPIRWIISFRDFILELKEFWTLENKTRLITLITQLFSFLIDLATHPLKTFIAVIEPVFLTLFSYLVAYALGTEKYELPEFPDWLNWTNENGNGVDPGKAKLNLGKPLKSLYVTGYRFNKPPGHMGLDLGVERGQRVFAMHSGTIEYVARAFVGYGHQVTIGGGNWWTRYAHLLTVKVSKGQAISKGEVIGTGNSTGNSSGDHLHLEIKYKGSFTDPEKILF